MSADFSQTVIDECVETPIEAAAQMGGLPMIEFGIERGARVDFFTACVLGRTDSVRLELAVQPGRARDRGVHELASLYSQPSADTPRSPGCCSRREPESTARALWPRR